MFLLTHRSNTVLHPVISSNRHHCVFAFHCWWRPLSFVPDWNCVFSDSPWSNWSRRGPKTHHRLLRGGLWNFVLEIANVWALMNSAYSRMNHDCVTSIRSRVLNWAFSVEVVTWHFWFSLYSRRRALGSEWRMKIKITVYAWLHVVNTVPSYQLLKVCL